LTDDQRHVIILRFLEGFNLNETAAILGKQVGHIKVIQNRAITKLRKALGDSGAETGISSNPR
jgi:RNA polymerase sigma-70 factor (ECF subfamily)